MTKWIYHTQADRYQDLEHLNTRHSLYSSICVPIFLVYLQFLDHHSKFYESRDHNHYWSPSDRHIVIANLNLLHN